MIPKYEYYLHVWGGFFNKHNQEVHGYKEGAYYFDDQYTRDLTLQNMQKACDKLGARDGRLMYKLDEGFHLRNLPICHRVVEYQGKQYYSTKVWDWREDLSTLEYVMQYKWYPGFNDEIIEETLEEKVDYDRVEIIQEWITGNFKVNSDYD